MRTKGAWERFYEGRPRPWGGAVEMPSIPPGSSVLELGCGGGRLLLPVLRRGTARRLVGVDFARTSLVQLAKDATGMLVQADAAFLPFRDGIFDTVLCRHLIGHLMEDGRRAAASEVLRTLKKGGRAFFEVFSTADARSGKGKRIEEGTFLRGDGITHHYFEQQELQGLFSGASSVTVKVHRWNEKAGAAMMERESLSAEILK
jgi:ubiquinone/menaquinone biosynthesis C-methylase UbiE